jgi:thiol:disulfide interchange protein/DsbC/DsbD-like thiol-disulfide interchange protein
VRLLVFLALLLLPFSAAQAQGTEPDKYVKIRLLAERGQVKGGDEIWVGTEQSIYPEWHTYWFNPGDSGAAPTVEWKLPEGFETGGINWPVPSKITYGPLANYGYANHALLLQRLTIPKNIPDGPITLAADVDVLVCKDICIPETGTYTLTLNDPGNIAEDNRAYFETALGKLPLGADWPALYHEEGGEFVLTITPPQVGLFSGSKGLAFYPTAWGVIANAEAPEFEIADTGLTIRQKRGERPLEEAANFEALVTFENPEGKTETFSFVAMPGTGATAPSSAVHADTKDLSLAAALLFALLGGVILNLMPCVFPVLSLKALSIVKHAGEPSARTAGLSYAAGVVLSFLGIAAILISLKAAGQSIGWGFQLQNPVIVALLAYLLFIIGLNLAGLFEISGRFGNIGNKLTQDTGAAGSFFTGVLATIVATPCTAPFMAAAVGYALIQPAPAALAIFAALGFGLALPVLLLSFVPALQKFLPRPGAWMDIFKQFLAFPIFASAAWLVWVLSQQAGSMGVLGVLMGMVAIAFGLWLLQHRPAKKAWKVITLILAILSFVFALGFLPTPEIENDLARSEKLTFGEPYSSESLAKLLLTDEPVFVEMTAAWCITCKLNHAVAIDTPDARAAFAQKKVHYLVGDWTNYDQPITDYLNSFGRNGVPLYVFYGPRDIVTGERPEPIVLPQLLTPGSIVETIGRF